MRIVIKWFDSNNRLSAARVVETKSIVAIDVDDKENVIAAQVMDAGELVVNRIDLDSECIADDDHAVRVHFNELRRVMLADLLEESRSPDSEWPLHWSTSVVTWSYYPQWAIDSSRRGRNGFSATGWERTV